MLSGVSVMLNLNEHGSAAVLPCKDSRSSFYAMPYPSQIMVTNPPTLQKPSLRGATELTLELSHSIEAR